MSQYLKLYDINKDELTDANISGLNKGLYSVTIGGAGDINFFFDVFGDISANTTTILFYTKSAVKLVGSVEYYSEGTWADNNNWIGCEPYDFDLKAVEAQRMNGIYPMIESHYHQPKRLHMTADGACTVYCKISIY